MRERSSRASSGSEHQVAVFRADASAEIGTGHVFRCAALAAELRSRGFETLFACRMLPGSLGEMLEAEGHRVVGLPAESPPEDAVDVIAAELGGKMAAILVMDDYGVGAAWQARARRLARRLVAIDDLAREPHDVDVLVNQNLGVRKSDYDRLVPGHCALLIGPAYALLRPQFRDARSRARAPRSRLSRVLVFISGADPHDVTRRAAAGAADAGVDVDVVTGPAYPHVATLREWAYGQERVRVHESIRDMASLMLAADLAIGAPSSASWERCCLALPTLLITLADNQANVGDALVEAGAARSLGWHHEVSQKSITDAVLALAGDTPELREMSARAFALVDGRGAERVSKCVLAGLTQP